MRLLSHPFRILILLYAAVSCLVFVSADTLKCEVAVVGGSLGASSAAYEAAMSGARTCLISDVEQLGGQATAQGTSAFDEQFLEFANSYSDLRNKIRQYYKQSYTVRDGMQFNADDGFNPGSCWVSRTCFEPTVAAHILEHEFLQPLVDSGNLVILKGFAPIKAIKDPATNALTSVSFRNTRDGSQPILDVNANIFIDATALGDVLPLAEAEFFVGAESKQQTGEPDAPQRSDPRCQQAFTYTFILEKRPEHEDNRIPKPANYNASNYALGGNWKFFQSQNDWYPKAWGGVPYSFWTYRRVLNPTLYRNNATLGELAMINWNGGNDFYDDVLVPVNGNEDTDTDDILRRARDHALGFVYWMQTDAPRDDGSGRGYPFLKLSMEAMGTDNGLSEYPYIRESRRIVAVTQLTQQDVSPCPPGASKPVSFHYKSCRSYDDSVGIARYPYDLHQRCPGLYPGGFSRASGSSQIPLSALIPKTVNSLLAGSLNIGTTHITNGMYRVHPAEWNIGLAVGAVAALSVAYDIQPRQILTNKKLLLQLQYRIVAGRGGPLVWMSDLLNREAPPKGQLLQSDACFVAAQMLSVSGVFNGVFNLTATDQYGVLFFPDLPVTGTEANTAINNLLSILKSNARVAKSAPGGPTDPITRMSFVSSLVASISEPVVFDNPLSLPTYADVCKSSPLNAQLEKAAIQGWLDLDRQALSGVSRVNTASCMSLTGENFMPFDWLTRRSLSLILWKILATKMSLPL